MNFLLWFPFNLKNQSWQEALLLLQSDQLQRQLSTAPSCFQLLIDLKSVEWSWCILNAASVSWIRWVGSPKLCQLAVSLKFRTAVDRPFQLVSVCVSTMGPATRLGRWEVGSKKWATCSVCGGYSWMNGDTLEQETNLYPHNVLMMSLWYPHDISMIPPSFPCWTLPGFTSIRAC